MVMVSIYMVFIYFLHRILVLLATLVLNKTGQVYEFKCGITFPRTRCSWYAFFIQAWEHLHSQCMNTSWEPRSFPNRLFWCSQPACWVRSRIFLCRFGLCCRLLSGREQSYSVAQAQVHALFWGIKVDCYRKMHLFVEFCSSSPFAARVESKQVKIN